MTPHEFLGNYINGFEIPLGSQPSNPPFNPNIQEGLDSFDDYIKWQLDNQLPGPNESVPAKSTASSQFGNIA